MKDFLGIATLAVIGVIFAVFFIALGNIIAGVLF
jgi:hypothetical protein